MCAITISNKRSLASALAASSNSRDQGRPVKRIRSILMSSLPDRMLQASVVCSPDTTVQSILQVPVETRPCDAMPAGFFHPPTAEEIAAYDHDVLKAVRSQDLEALAAYHAQERPLKCSNKFGESLLHLACRRGFSNVTQFLVEQANVPVTVCDDYGRTPLHDLCWTFHVHGNLALADLILERCPDLLYVKDKRGNTALSYLRRDQWATWNSHLMSKYTAATLSPQSFQVQ